MPEPSGLIDNSVKTNPKDAYYRLTKLLGSARLVRLVELLEDVIDESGYGDVKIVVADGQVQLLKAERSYR